MIDVVALGELLIDFTCVSTDAEGYPTMAAHPGGAPANFLAALTKFGASTAFLGKVGTDALGKLLTGTLQKAGIETRGLIASDDVFTTLAFVTLDESGDREFSFSRKPGADTCITFEELDLSLVDEAKVLHFGTLSLTDEPARSATYQLVDYAKSTGKLITYDPNLRKPLWKDLEEAKKQMLWGLSKADVVKISDEEVQFLFGLGVKEGAQYILEHYPVKLVFVTCGPEGCFFQNAAGQGMVPGTLMIANALSGKPLPVYGEGLNVRDWLYVEDHCKAIDLILHKGTVGEVYNIGGHNEMRNIDIVKIICKALDKPESLITYVRRRWSVYPTR